MSPLLCGCLPKNRGENLPKWMGFISMEKPYEQMDDLGGRQATCDTTNSITCSSPKCHAKIPSLVAVQPFKNKNT